jgi:hypothetical protein
VLLTRVLVDFGHASCTQDNKCSILNCPFNQFASSYNYTCLNVGDLQNGDSLFFDKEIIQQKVFTSGYEVKRISKTSLSNTQNL